MDETKQKNIEQKGETTFSFSPVAYLDDEQNEKPVEVSADLDKVIIQTAEKPETERLATLRSYYAQLGKVREDMEQELQKVLDGTVVDGEIESKLYEFSHSWQAVANEINQIDNLSGRRQKLDPADYHVGENLAGQDFSGQYLPQKDFSAANLQDANFVNAQLNGADFTGADLSGADLTGADLTDCIFAGATLHGTNFIGANMEGVILRDADIEDAILIDVNMDELAVEELQALVEYLAIYYPHKLNLRRINLSLLNLRRIDLRRVSLRGVDFTGCDFTGVNVMELDLSECIITPEQIAQALGRIPSPEELKKILAPKNKKKAKKFYIDFTDFLSNGHFLGWVDLTKNSISTQALVNAFMKTRNMLLKKPEEKDALIFEKAMAFHEERLAEERKTYNEEQRRNIEERKQRMLEEGQERASREEKYTPIHVDMGRGRESN